MSPQYFAKRLLSSGDRLIYDEPSENVFLVFVTGFSNGMIAAESRDRVSLPLDIDAAGAALGANCEQGAILSPQLKDKHIQRLRALRERLQALKQLRSPPREPSDSGSDGFEVIAVRNGEPLPREDGPVGRGGKDYETPEASDGILEGAHVEEVEDSTVTFGALKKRGDTRSVGDHLVNQDDQSEDDRGLFSADDGLTGGGERFTPRRASLKGNSGMLIPGHIRQQKSWASPYHSGDEARKADVEARTDFELGLDQGAEDYHGRQARAEGGGRSFAHETSGLTAQGVIDHTDIPEGVPPDDETDQGQSIGINFETTIAAVPGGIVTARSSTEVPQQKEILASKGSKAMVERSDREQVSIMRMLSSERSYRMSTPLEYADAHINGLSHRRRLVTIPERT